MIHEFDFKIEPINGPLVEYTALVYIKLIREKHYGQDTGGNRGQDVTFIDLTRIQVYEKGVLVNERENPQLYKLAEEIYYSQHEYNIRCGV